MAKLKNLLIVASALMLLIAAVALFPPAPGHSQGTPPAGFPVEVVNSSDKPLPTSVKGTTTVTGVVALAADTKVGIDPAGSSVNVANTPTVALSANANTVRITNTAGTPAFVRDIDDGARQPYQGEATIMMAEGATTGMARLTFANNSQTVPAGKRLVIEQVSARALVPSGFGTVAQIETRVDNRPARHFLVLNSQGFNPFGFERVSSNQQLRVYADPGTPVNVVVNIDGGLPFGSGNVEVLTATVSGYLVDVP